MAVVNIEAGADFYQGVGGGGGGGGGAHGDIL